jgi:hypothetical protein
MNYENKITKENDLAISDSISCFNNWISQQNHNAFEVFHNFIKDVSPKRIIEIGTAFGGFTRFLKYTTDKLNLDCDVSSYEIHHHPSYDEIRDMGVDVRIENIFLEEYTKVPQYVIDLIQSEGTTIILCDGGWKVGEFNILSNYMKSGDHILAHDYAFDGEFFINHINEKIWNWHEISEADIIKACERNNLEDYQRDVFQSVAWVSKIKK